MNHMQKKALIAVGAIVLGMLLSLSPSLYPPYRVYSFVHYNSLDDTGYALIFDLPSRAVIGVTTLFVQWVGVLIVGAIAFFVLKDK